MLQSWMPTNWVGNAYYIIYSLKGHETYLPGTDSYNQIIETFGSAVVEENESKTINRKALGGIVFGSPDKMKQLTQVCRS